MKHLSNADYSRLRYWRTFAWVLFGLAWMWGWAMTVLWQSEKYTAMRLRSNLLYVAEMKTTWTGE
jgi:hypothetical protein